MMLPFVLIATTILGPGQPKTLALPPTEFTTAADCKAAAGVVRAAMSFDRPITIFCLDDMTGEKTYEIVYQPPEKKE